MQPKTIMLLEDNPDLLFSFMEFFTLERPGYTLVTFTNGQEAWENLARRRIEYDAIILDNMVAGMSGMEIAKKINEDEQLSNIPVIMQSGKVEEHIAQEAYDSGVCKYLVKPYSMANFVHTLDEILLKESSC